MDYLDLQDELDETYTLEQELIKTEMESEKENKDGGNK